MKGNNIYGHMAVGEESEDSENSSVYHEPYKLLPSTKQEYGCLIKKEAITSSKSGEYTGKYVLSWHTSTTTVIKVKDNNFV